ncbi:hypothetical protein NBRC116594_34090 [Shimia sp. NS0008-38b]|uniref:hypothetical protein n=1 Tax=Shimia sp. NS0008-38b TaxID=3127653 RepID=UPI00310A00C0
MMAEAGIELRYAETELTVAERHFVFPTFGGFLGQAPSVFLFFANGGWEDFGVLGQVGEVSGAMVRNNATF